MSLQRSIEAIEPAIVQIESGASSGTGFFVGKEGFVVTAKHVLAGEPLRVCLAHRNEENFRANFTAVRAAVVEEDPLHDLALLKTERNPFAGEVTTGIQIGDQQLELPVESTSLDVARPSDGTAIAVSGYPLQIATMVTTSGAVATAWSWEEIEAPGAGERRPRIHHLDRYLADISVNPGNSGGPCYLADTGHVVGVCVNYTTAPTRDSAGNVLPIKQNSGLSGIIPAKYVVELLERNNVDWILALGV